MFGPLENFFSGGEAARDENGGVNKTRINEGYEAQIAQQGELTNMSVLAQDQLREIQDLQVRAYQETISTVSQQAADTYIADEVIGGPGGADGDIRAEGGSGKLAGNAGEAQKEGASAIDLNPPPAQTCSSGGYSSDNNQINNPSYTITGGGSD